MPLLSELLSSESVNPVVYGIVPDVAEFNPPSGLKEAGIVSTMPAGEIDEDVLDVVISWGLAGVPVTIEVPAASSVADPRHLVSTAASISTSLSLLPPEGDGDEAFESYVRRVEEFARAYVAQPNFTGYVVPVTSYLEYLFIEVLAPEKAAVFAPSNPYVVESYASRMTAERADAMKARLRSVFHEAYGGEAAFVTLARTLFSAIYDRLEENCREELDRRANVAAGRETECEPPAADIA